MATQIYVNLPVKNLDKSVAFFTALGFKFNPQFTDENATCMIVSENNLRDAAGRELLQDLHAQVHRDAKEHRGAAVPSCDSRGVDAWQGAGCRRQHAQRRRTTASCTSTASRTWTATSGSWRTWT